MNIKVTGKNNSLIFHKNVQFKECGRVLLEDEGNSIEIGENSAGRDIFFAVRGFGGKAVLGKDCMFSAKVVIRTSDAHSILNEANEHINPERDTIIEDRVWIGYGATILKGSHIGKDCIIGMESVVAGRTIPDGCVAAGNPAKVVKENVHWVRERLR